MLQVISDHSIGSAIVSFSVVSFVYYTLWVIVIVSMDTHLLTGAWSPHMYRMHMCSPL